MAAYDEVGQNRTIQAVPLETKSPDVGITSVSDETIVQTAPARIDENSSSEAPASAKSNGLANNQGQDQNGSVGSQYDVVERDPQGTVGETKELAHMPSQTTITTTASSLTRLRSDTHTTHASVSDYTIGIDDRSGHVSRATSSQLYINPEGSFPRLSDSGVVSAYGRMALIRPQLSRDLSRRMSPLYECVASTNAKLVQVLELASPSVFTASSFNELLRTITEQRLRQMPHKGSRLDRYLSMAEFFVNRLKEFSSLVAKKDTSAGEAGRLVCGCIKLLLMDDILPSSVLEKLFTVLAEVGSTLSYFTDNEEYANRSSGASTISRQTFVTLIGLCSQLIVAYKAAGGDALIQIFFLDFEKRFGRALQVLSELKAEFSVILWRFILEDNSDPVLSSNVSIELIRSWLAGFNPGSKVHFSDFASIGSPRQESSFEWLAPLISSFFRAKEDLLILSGQVGTGKSLIMSHALERVRAMHGHRSKLLYFSIDPYLPSHCSSLRLVGSLLLQLLERSVGNLALISDLSNIYRRVETHEIHDEEEELWKILDRATQREQSEITIVVDGLDQVEGEHPTAIRVCERLRSVVGHSTKLRCILLARPFLSKIPPNSREFFLDIDIIAPDIRQYLEFTIRHSSVFSTLETRERDLLLRRILDRSFKSFLEAKIILQLLEQERTYIRIIRFLDTAPRSLSGLIDSMCLRIDWRLQHIVTLFLWLLAAVRPLTVKEFQKLSEEDSSLRQVCDLLKDSTKLKAATNQIVEIRGNQVHFVLPHVKEQLLRLCESGSLPFRLQDAHGKILEQALVLIKRNLKDPETEPTFELDLNSDLPSTLENRLEKTPFLEYALRYYLLHYKHSTHAKLVAENTCPNELKANLTESVFVVLAEQQTWRRQYGLDELEAMHTATLRLRRLAFGNSSKSVLQNLIILSQYRLKLSDYERTVTLLLDIWETGRRTLGSFHAVCISAAEEYLRIVETHIGLDHVGFGIELEKIYGYLWEVYKHQNGPTDRSALRFADALCAFYNRALRAEGACAIYRQLYDAFLARYGPLHEMTIRYAQNLLALLEELHRFDECSSVCEVLLAATDASLDPWDQARIDATFRLMRIHEQQGAKRKAEGVLRSLWKILHDIMHDTADEKSCEAYIDVSIELIQLLTRFGRREEATGIAVHLADIQVFFKREGDFINDSLSIKIRLIAEIMMEMELFELASSLFLELRSWYGPSRSTTSEAILIAIALSKCYRLRHEGENEESILRDLYDLLIRSGSDNDTLISISLELGEFYEARSRWSQAIEICHGVSQRLWPAVLTRQSSKPSLPTEYRRSTLKIASALAKYHLLSGHLSEAEGIDSFCFKACKSSLPLTDPLLLVAAENLTTYFDKRGMVDDAIRVWDELREECFEELGRQHEMSVRIVRFMCDLCTKHHRPEFESILIEVIDSFGHGPNAVRPQVIDIISQLLILYEAQKKTNLLRQWYRHIWLAYQDRGNDCGIDGDTYYTIFVKHLALLDGEDDRFEAIKLARDLRSLCIHRHGIHGVLTIRVTLELAQCLEKDEARYDEAIKLYEEVLEVSLDNFAERDSIKSLIRRAKGCLAGLYMKHHHTAPRAEVIYTDIWMESKNTYGCSHERSLGALAQLIKYYIRQSLGHVSETALKTLQEAVIEILKIETDSIRLFKAAKAIAEMYILLEAKSAASKLINSIRLRFIRTRHTHENGRPIAEDLAAAADITDRRSFIFVYALDLILAGQDPDNLFEKVMHDLLAETSLYESWLRALHYGGRLETRLSVGGRLANFFERAHRHAESQLLEEEMWTVFHKELGADPTRSGTLWNLFQICLVEMSREGTFVPLLGPAVNTVMVYIDSAQFKQAYDLAVWINSFVIERGGFGQKDFRSAGIRLAVRLASRFELPVRDHGLESQMKRLSSEIMIQVLRAGVGTELDFGSMSEEEVHALIVILGEQGEYESLESILQSLWDSRTQRSWKARTIVTIGQRLCEVRFAAGHHELAIHLLEDICYNLGNVYGPLNTLTVKCQTLLSQFHNSCGQHDRAMGPPIDVLRIALDRGKDNHSTVTTEMILEQLRQLKLTYQRYGRWPHGKEYYSDVIREFKAMYQDEDRFSDLADIDKWIVQESLPRNKAYGCWQAPSDWGFLQAADEDEALMYEDTDDEDATGVSREFRPTYIAGQ